MRPPPARLPRCARTSSILQLIMAGETARLEDKVADAVQAKAEQVRDDASAAVQQKVADVKAAPGNALLNAKAAVDEQQAAAKAKVGPHARTS